MFFNVEQAHDARARGGFIYKVEYHEHKHCEVFEKRLNRRSETSVILRTRLLGFGHGLV